jgi:hypothetical protein
VLFHILLHLLSDHHFLALCSIVLVVDFGAGICTGKSALAPIPRRAWDGQGETARLIGSLVIIEARTGRDTGIEVRGLSDLHWSYSLHRSARLPSASVNSISSLRHQYLFNPFFPPLATKLLEAGKWRRQKAELGIRREGTHIPSSVYLQQGQLTHTLLVKFAAWQA